MLRIKTKKGDICPICRRQIISPNMWVRYHIKYTPEMVILACKYCNLIEKQLRNGEPVAFSRRNEFSPNKLTRAERVIEYMKIYEVFYC